MSLKSRLGDRVVALRNSVLILPVIVAFLTSSCVKETSLIGLGLVPSNDKIYSFYTDTITVYSSLVVPDSVSGYGIIDFIFGSYYDPVFGVSSANVITQLSWGYAGFRYGPHPVADSVIMRIKYKYQYIYGNKNSTLHFKVYELVDGFFNTDKTNRRWDTIPYYSPFNIQPILGNQIGQFDFRPASQSNDSIIKFNLDPEFGNRLIQDPDTFTYDSAFYFHNNINSGIAIIPDKPAISGEGYIFKTYYNADYFWVDVYYRNDTISKDSISHFAVTTDDLDARLNLYEHDYTLSKFYSQLIAPNTQDTFGYLSSMGGVMTKLSFPGLNALKSKPTDVIAINSAELILPVFADDTFNTPPSGVIQLLHKGTTGAYSVLPDYTYFGSSDAYIDGIYDKYNRLYTTEITKHIEYCFTHKDYGQDLYIRANTSSSSAFPEYIFAGRSILRNGTGKNKIKLRVTYTKK